MQERAQKLLSPCRAVVVVPVGGSAAQVQSTQSALSTRERERERVGIKGYTQTHTHTWRQRLQQIALCSRATEAQWQRERANEVGSAAARYTAIERDGDAGTHVHAEICTFVYVCVCSVACC